MNYSFSPSIKSKRSDRKPSLQPIKWMLISVPSKCCPKAGHYLCQQSWLFASSRWSVRKLKIHHNTKSKRLRNGFSETGCTWWICSQKHGGLSMHTPTLEFHSAQSIIPRWVSFFPGVPNLSSITSAWDRPISNELHPFHPLAILLFRAPHPFMVLWSWRWKHNLGIP